MIWCSSGIRNFSNSSRSKINFSWCPNRCCRQWGEYTCGRCRYWFSIRCLCRSLLRRYHTWSYKMKRRIELTKKIYQYDRCEYLDIVEIFLTIDDVKKLPFARFLLVLMLPCIQMVRRSRTMRFHLMERSILNWQVSVSYKPELKNRCYILGDAVFKSSFVWYYDLKKISKLTMFLWLSLPCFWVCDVKILSYKMWLSRSTFRINLP